MINEDVKCLSLNPKLVPKINWHLVIKLMIWARVSSTVQFSLLSQREDLVCVLNIATHCLQFQHFY